MAFVFIWVQISIINLLIFFVSGVDLGWVFFGDVMYLAIVSIQMVNAVIFSPESQHIKSTPKEWSSIS